MHPIDANPDRDRSHATNPTRDAIGQYLGALALIAGLEIAIALIVLALINI